MTMKYLLLQGRAQDWLPFLGPRSVHLVVTDPPWPSVDLHRSQGALQCRRLKGWFPTMTYQEILEVVVQLAERLVPDAHLYLFADPVSEQVMLTGRSSNRELPAWALDGLPDGIPVPPGLRAWPSLVWAKTLQGIPVDQEELCERDIRQGMGYHWSRAHELILFLEKGRRPLNDLGWRSILCGPRASRKDYPTAKPVQVCRRLIENSSDPGDLVLDPFCGGGSVLEAAFLAGRRAIGIDVSTRAIEHSQARLEALGAEVEVGVPAKEEKP